MSNSLNAEVDWNAEEKKVTITKDGIEIVLYIGEAIAYINGEEYTLDVPAGTENSRTIVPIRFISEAFNAYVDYEEETESVIIVEEDENVEGDPATEPVADEEVTKKILLEDPVAEEEQVVEDPTTEPEK
ncbi:copper amine oxidase N-terminal domain-containing protein [Anaerobacillus sp. HL2]|nr:copper amine oxidase N-terminal domain-containing protein [Anaerobacillus sp. HL2]